MGGRVLTENLNGTPIDLGAMLLVGQGGNPLVALGEQTGCKMHSAAWPTEPKTLPCAPLGSPSDGLRFALWWSSP